MTLTLDIKNVIKSAFHHLYKWNQKCCLFFHIHRNVCLHAYRTSLWWKLSALIKEIWGMSCFFSSNFLLIHFTYKFWEKKNAFDSTWRAYKMTFCCKRNFSTVQLVDWQKMNCQIIFMQKHLMVPACIFYWTVHSFCQCVFLGCV